MALPAISPSAVVTPLDTNGKRKHQEIIDLTEDEADETVMSPTLPATLHAEDVDENGAGSEAGSEVQREAKPEKKVYDDAINDYVDHYEEHPFPIDGTLDIDAEQAISIRRCLTEIGAEDFLAKVIEQDGLNPRKVGIIFGLDPFLEVEEDYFLEILGCAVARTEWRRNKLTWINTIADAGDLLRKCKNILVITGAGISTSLGIPDFRSKGTGFYSKLEAMGYDDPQEVFDLELFDHDPSKFYQLAGDILPDQRIASPTHEFIRMLQEKNRLQTNYTQNIDNLEALAGIDPERLIQCHGSFATASCRRCGNKVKGTDIFDDIRAKQVATCKVCPIKLPVASSKRRKRRRADDDSSDEDKHELPAVGVMKPDITFFGERLPEDFFDRLVERDADVADLVIVIGTSLKVAPVSHIPNFLPHAIPHIYISREPIKHVNFDIQLLGDCDHVVFELCKQAGWNLKHEMIPRGFKTKVRAVEGYNHHWTVKPAVKEIADSQEFDEPPEVQLAVRPPSKDGPESHVSTAPHLLGMFGTAL